MKKLFAFVVLFYCLCFSAGGQTYRCEQPVFQFNIPEKEYNCMRLFNADAADPHPVNVYLLAKFTELLYQERLDYQIRYLRNNSQTLTTLPSTRHLLENLRTTDEHFECAFAARTSHFFYDPRSCPSNPVDSVAWAADNLPLFRYIYRSHFDTLSVFGLHHMRGLDPEFIIISTADLVLILFRGTDYVGEDKISEWTGTDFKIPLTRAGGALTGCKIHQGFWESFDLIRDDLMLHLHELKAQDKKIWLSGHSLGGAMAMIAGCYLKASGYDVKNVYAFAAPKTIGNKSLTERASTLLPGRIQRFEYYLDPIPLLWSPLYAHIGQRNWYDHETKGQYKYYENLEERFISANPLVFNRSPFKESRSKEEVRLHKAKMDGLVIELPIAPHFHNPPWYVKAAHAQLSEPHKLLLPDVQDSFPYIYIGKPGSK